MNWHIDWPSFAFGCSAGFVVAIFLLALLRAVAEVDMVPRYPVGKVPPRDEWNDEHGSFGAPEGAQRQ